MNRKTVREEALIPEGWQKVALGEFMEFKNGINADKSAYGQGTKFVNIMDVFRKSFLKKDDITGLVRITDKQLSEYSVIHGDILFNRTSETREEIAYSTVYTDKETVTFGGFVIRGRQKKNLLLPAFAGYCFKNETTRKEMIRRSQGAVRANIGQKDLNKVPILIPPMHEQEKIAQILSKWDTAIEKTDALITAKQKQFEWLQQKFFTPKNLLNHNWEIRKIKEFMRPRNEKALPSEELPLYSLTIENGVTAKTERYNREFLVKDTTNKSYKVVYPKDIVFNPANLRWGAIARSEVSHKVLLSPIYEVMEAIDLKINIDFLTYLLTCTRQIKIFASKVEGTLIERMAVKADVFLLCEILVPTSREEQNYIAYTLTKAKREVMILQNMAKKYRIQKNWLIQKLLSGTWRITPDNRQAYHRD